MELIHTGGMATPGKVKPFGQKDNGGDLVETAFLIQGLLAVHQYYVNGNEKEKALADVSTKSGAMSTGTGTGKADRTCSTGIGVLRMVGKWISPFMATTNA